MSEIIDITELVRRRHRVEGRQFVVAVDDSLYAQLAPGHQRPCVIDGLPARYVPSSALGPEEHADLAVGPYVPSAPGREPILHTLADEWIEQDPQGRLFRDGYLLWDAPLIAFGIPRVIRYHALELGTEAAFFFMSRTPDGWAFAISTTAPVLALLRPPRTRPASIVPTMWLDLAYRALDGANFDDGGDEGA